MNRRAALALAVLVALGAARLECVAGIRLNLSPLAQASTTIVRGRVTAVENRWNPRSTTFITNVTVAVDQVMKGSPGATVVLAGPGAGNAGTDARSAGPAQLQQGADYILFLEPARQDPGKYLVVSA